MILFMSGNYYDTLINVNGCDSIVLINLTLNPPVSATINSFLHLPH